MTTAASAETLQLIPLDQLKPNPWNRTVFDPEGIKDLALSIRNIGLREPLLVRSSPSGGYQIASGHRRWLALKEAGLKEAMCIVQDLDDRSVAEDNINLNIHREDLPPFELGRMLKAYKDLFHIDQGELAVIFNKSEGWASQYLGYLDLHPDIQNFTAVKFSTGDLRALKQLPKDHQQRVADELKAGTIKQGGIQKRCNQLRFGNSQAQKVGTKGEVSPWRMGDEPSISHSDSRVYLQVSFDPKARRPEQFIQDLSAKLDRYLTLNPDALPSDQALERIYQPSTAMPEPEPAIPPSMEKWMPSNDQEWAQYAKDTENVLLPQTPQEEDDLEKMALQGPAAVYVQIYGADSWIAKKVSGATWKDLGVDDPVTGARTLVAALKQGQSN